MIKEDDNLNRIPIIILCISNESGEAKRAYNSMLIVILLSLSILTVFWIFLSLLKNFGLIGPILS
jgi:hypothetical protein